jgi:hypothetical protein
MASMDALDVPGDLEDEDRGLRTKTDDAGDITGTGRAYC